MIILQTPKFAKQFKRLFPKDQKIIEKAISDIIKNPDIGAARKGDLKNIQVHKIHLDKLLYLIA